MSEINTSENTMEKQAAGSSQPQTQPLTQPLTIEEIFQTLDALFAENKIEQVEPFLLNCLTQAKETDNYGVYISVANEMIGYYRSTSQHKKAFDAAEDVLMLMEELQLDGTEHFATTLLNTATAYRAGGLLKEAYTYYRRALQIYETILQPEDFRFAGLYNNMSILLEEMGENEQALALLQQALAIIQKLPNGEMEQATTLTNMGLLYFKLQKAEEAGRCLNEAMQLFEAKGEQTDAHYSAALAGIAEAHYRMGDYSSALTCYEKALAEIKKHFGENQSYAIVCENCAAVCEALQDTEKQQHYRNLADTIYKELSEQ